MQQNVHVAKPRVMQNVHDMVLSMGLVIAVVALLLGVTHRSHQQVVYPVDYDATVAQAASSGAFPIVEPSPLPEGLTPSVARFEPETYGKAGDMRLYVGFTTASGGFVSVWQSNGGHDKVIANATNDGACEAAVDGWQRCEQAKPLTRALVRVGDSPTLVVSGTVDWATLAAVRDSLAPARK